MGHSNPSLTAISGGIGSGKSVVAHIVAAMGYDVYDCDLRARALMESAAIREALAEEFGSEIFDDSGTLIRPALAAIVFADGERLQALNAITHAAVRADLTSWAEAHSGGRAFVETAILYQSGLDKMVGRVWEVVAPRHLRISRVVARNGLTESEVIARIESQDNYTPSSPHPVVSTILNDGFHPLLPQIEALLDAQ